MAYRINRERWYRDLNYVPRAWQKTCDEALDLTGKRFVSAFAFPRSGKSYWAARYVGPRLLQPDHHSWIVAPTYELGSKEFLYVYNDLLELGYLGMRGVIKHKDIRGGNLDITLPWGSFLRVKSAEQPLGLRAEELDTLILAEASGLSEQIYYNHLYIRLEKRQGKVLIPTTPKGFNWIYDKFRIPAMKTIRGVPNDLYDPEFLSLVISADPELVQPNGGLLDDPDYADIYEPSVYPLERVKLYKKRMPWPIYLEQVGGCFSSYAGLVLPYNRQRHRVQPFPIPDHWTHCVGWDQGTGGENDPTAIVIFSYDENGHVHFWAEHRGPPGATAAQHLAAVRAILGPNRALSAVGVDPSAKQVRIELQAVGLSTSIAFDKSVDAGILRLTELLNSGAFHLHEGKCPNFENELEHLQWDEKKRGKIKEGQADHFFDAARYGTLLEVPRPVATGLISLGPGANDPAWRAAWKEVIEMQQRAFADKLLPEEDDPWADQRVDETFDDSESDWL